MNKKLSKKVLNLSGFGDLGFTLFINIELYYWSAFLTDYAEFSLTMVTIILTLSSVIDCIWVPFTGWLIEKCSFKWGKFRSWLVIAPPVMIFTYAFMFTKIGSSEIFAAGVVVTAFCIKTLAQDLAYSASIAMVSDLSNDPGERMVISTRRGQYLAVGNIVFSIIALPIIGLLTRFTGNDILGYTLTALIFGVLNFLCYFVAFRVTKGYSVSETISNDQKDISAKKEKLSTSEMLKAVFKNPPLLALIVSDSFREIAYFLMSAAGYYYFVVVLNNLAAMTIYLVITKIVGLMGASAANYCAKKFGKRKAYLVSSAIMIVFLVLCYWFGRDLIWFIVFQVFVNFFLQITVATLTAMFADTVIYYEHKTGKDARGFIMTMLIVPVKVGAILKSTILGLGLALTGYVANAKPTEEVVDGIAKLMNLYPAVFMTVCFIIFMLGYKLTEDKVLHLTNELEEKKTLKI